VRVRRNGRIPIGLRSCSRLKLANGCANGLVSAAQADARIGAAALVGSSALGSEDEWSDIDLALCIDAESERATVIAEWTDWMYGKHTAVHHMDVLRGETL
jgi:hypothetical protein